MKLKVIFFFFLVLALRLSIAQDPYNYENELARMVNIPNSPEAQGFTQYGNTSVSLYTGTPNIAIPLHTFQGRELDLPLALTYDATGIKVEQIASQVGLGWNLNVGGRISRIANGYPDDFFNAAPEYFSFWDNVVQPGIDVQQGMLTYSEDSESFGSVQEATDFLTFMKLMNENKLETQPDYFSLNVLGINDYIVFDVATREPRTLHNPRIDVDFTQDPTTKSVTGWTVTNEDGTKFYFTKAEETYSTNGDIELSGFAGIVKDYNSSWVLTKIESPNKKDVYEFEYVSLGRWLQQRATYAQHVSHDINDRVLGGQTYQESTAPAPDSYYNVDQWFLTEIKHNTNKIVSVQLKNRNDLDIASAIDQIVLYKSNIANGVLRKFTFNHTYFGEETPGTPIADLNAKAHLRLKLDELLIESDQNNIYQKYSFDYESSDDVPSRLSFGQDYLGYYNGMDNNQVLYPKVKIGEDIYEGADRDPDFDSAKIGMLTRITYPTGGYSDFEYEPHKTVYNATDKAKDEETQQNYAYGQLALTGGIDQETNCGPCCQDQFGNPPKVASTTFMIETAGNYNVSYSFSGGSGVFNDAFLFYNLPISPNLFGQGVGGCPVNKNLIYDEIIDQNSPGCSSFVTLKWQKADGYNQTVYLEPGCYQLTLLNANAGETSQVTVHQDGVNYSGTLNEGEVPRAGIRIKSISDYSADNELALFKTYKYTDGINSTNSSGIIEFQPQLTYYSQYEIIANTNDVDPINGYGGEGFVGITSINKVAHSSGGDRPHIVYPKVYEIRKASISESGTPIGYTEYNFNTGNSGIFSYGVPPNANYYVSDYKIGKEKNITTFDQGDTPKSEETKEYLNYSYYTNKGLFLENIPINRHKFPVIYEDTPGQFKHKFERGTLIGFGINGLQLQPPLVAYDGSCPGLIPGTSISCFCTETCTEFKDYCEYYNDLGYNYTCLYNTEFSTFKMRTTSAGGKVGATVKVETKEFYGNDTITKITDLEYDPDVDYLLRKSSTTSSDDNTVSVKYYYPKDEAGITALKSQNRLAEVTKTESYKNDDLIFTRENSYYTSGNLILPSTIKTQKSTDASTLENRVHFEYYSNGNLKEAYQENGPSTVYLWGYDNQYPIAKLENTTYTEVSPHIGSIVSLSDADNDRTKGSVGNEGAVRDALNSLRSQLPDALITTYTYDPMIGITSLTDTSGYTLYYGYDEHHRVENIKDQNAYLEKEFFYHYKGEPVTHVDLSLGALTGPDIVYTNENPSFSTSVNSGSGNYSYEWRFKKPDGTLSSLVSGATVNYSFDSSYVGGTSQVICTVTDTGSNIIKSLEKDITVYNPMSVSVNATYDAQTVNWAVAGDNLATFFSATASGGSESYSYTWKFQKPDQTFGTNATGVQVSRVFDNSYVDNNTATTVTCTIKDLVTNQELTSTALSITVYPALSLSSISSVAWRMIGEYTTFTVSAGGGSGSYTYQWVLDGPSTSPLDVNQNSNAMNYTFPASYEGITVVTCTLTDNTTGKSQSSTKNITIYDVPQLVNSDITGPATATVNTTTTFNVAAARGGSGDFSYRWSIISEHTPPNTDNLGPFTEANRNLENYTMTYDHYGDTKVQCRVEDNITGEYATAFVDVEVDGSSALTGLKMLKGTDLDAAADSAQHGISTLGPFGGSGNYTYTWYVDNSEVQSGASGVYNYIYLNCNQSGSDSVYVRVVAHDTLTGASITKDATYDLDYTCNPNGNQ